MSSFRPVPPKRAAAPSATALVPRRRPPRAASPAAEAPERGREDEGEERARTNCGPAGHPRECEKYTHRRTAWRPSLRLPEAALDRGDHATNGGVVVAKTFDLPDGADDGRVVLAAEATADLRVAHVGELACQVHG